jgi:hypothetical protein
MNERLGWLTRCGKNPPPLTERTSHVKDEGEEEGQIALKVSDSENRFLVWLTQTSLNVPIVSA